MYDVYACVRVCCMRAWPWAGEMGIRIRRKWISAPDAHPEPEIMVGIGRLGPAKWESASAESGFPLRMCIRSPK